MKVNVTIKAGVRHGDLHLAIKKHGLTKLSQMLGMPKFTVGAWYRYERCPPLKERLPYWPQERIDELEKKLFEITGKLLEDLFPETIQSKSFLKSKKNFDVTKEIESGSLLAIAENIKQISYVSPDFIEAEELSREVMEMIDTLTEREKQVIQKRYGFDGLPMTLEQIAIEQQVTTERVRQIEMRAIRKLQEPHRSIVLLEHLEY